jgi:hypothetical protein
MEKALFWSSPTTLEPPCRAKTELQKHISEIRMLRQAEGKKGFYVAEGNWDLLAGYGEDAGNSATKRIRMVAGGGFEPPTFGL